MKRFLVVTFLILGAAAAALFLFDKPAKIALVPGPPLIGYAYTDEGEYLLSQKVEKGKTFANIAESFGIGYEDMLAILESAKDKYNLEKIVEGHELSFIAEKANGELEKLVYQIDSEEALILEKNASDTWSGERIDIPYETELDEIGGVIESSLFEAVVGAGGPVLRGESATEGKDERVALALAEMFAWQIDFATDIRTGDSFRAIYEKRFLNGSYVAPGHILAAEFTNDGAEFRGVYFSAKGGSASGGKDLDGKAGYYDLEGLSLQKIFLKSPLSYKYISSGFSYNRLNPVTRTNWGPHRAIDYAAPAGTPVTSVGDGTVISSGWKGDLGIAVFVRHNETYTTVYGHFSRTAVRQGAKVKQGQVIGYVGATGLVTGPHLHYEIRKFGTRVNPLTIELPPGDPVAKTDREAFQKTLAQYKEFFE
ncbi:MAG: peptidoglycan DD-metalloendopeptidase family protein [Patescibacteria group bacterium]